MRTVSRRLADRIPPLQGEHLQGARHGRQHSGRDADRAAWPGHRSTGLGVRRVPQDLQRNDRPAAGRRRALHGTNVL
ncbi:hypothetical protein CCS38_28455, partial [Streptomyces purpurogeneiscleroticus]|nr:hypothetical protein [Streptomyces purpurogeneiscleroticus]